MNITFGGNPLTVLGTQVKLGDKAKEFTLLKNDLSESTLDDYKGKIKATKVSTGEEIILNTTHEAKLMGCSQGTVSLCLNGKRKTHKGFKFEWLNN